MQSGTDSVILSVIGANFCHSGISNRIVRAVACDVCGQKFVISVKRRRTMPRSEHQQTANKEFGESHVDF